MKRELTKYLDHLEEEELRQEILQLYKKLPVVREYYQMELGDSTKALVDKYKKDIRKAFFPARGRGRRGRSESRKVIRAFEKISIHQKDIIELLFYRVSVMVDYLTAHRLISESFHDSIVTSYAEACRLTEKEILTDYFREKAREVALHHEYNKRLYGHSLLPIWEEHFG
jgi:hypothetical protein